MSKGDIQALVCGVGEAASRPSAPVAMPYNKGQDFRRFVDFFTVEEWHALDDAMVPAEVKLARIIQKVAGLGCSVASEKTKTMMTAMWMIAKEGFDASVAHGAQQKNDAYDHVREQMNSVTCTRLPVKELPSPALYAKAYPAQWKALFGV